MLISWKKTEFFQFLSPFQLKVHLSHRCFQFFEFFRSFDLGLSHIADSFTLFGRLGRNFLNLLSQSSNFPTVIGLQLWNYCAELTFHSVNSPSDLSFGLSLWLLGLLEPSFKLSNLLFISLNLTDVSLVGILEELDLLLLTFKLCVYIVKVDLVACISRKHLLGVFSV